MNRINAIIVEDEVQSQKLLKQIIDEYCPVLKCVGVAGCATQAKMLIEKHNPDLVFLDVELDDANGFDLLDEMKDRAFKVIFTTAYDQYAVKAFKYQAIDYILKPYNPKDIILAVEKVKTQTYDQEIFKRLGQLIEVKKNGAKKRSIEISSVAGVQMVEVDTIIRVEASGAYSTIYFNNHKPIFLSKPIKDLESDLPTNQFYRTHKSHLVNLNQVLEYKHEDGGYAIMTTNTNVPIARRRKDEFLNQWSSYKGVT